MEPGNWNKAVSIAGLVSCWILIALLLTHLFFSDSGFRANRELSHRLKLIESENQRLISENKTLKEQIRYRRSTDYLNELARTEFRYVAEDETLYFQSTPTPGASHREQDIK